MNNPFPELTRAAAGLAGLPAGTRVVVRYRMGGGVTDALGELAEDSTGAGTVSISTRRGVVVVPVELITHAKRVPPPPPRRPR